ncbi:hypothetical protein [Marispirochaeta sp.]|uniref:hypothetical protein n=1 Tax=Marispirochaeta sp. TaxID=2038653 RepID=UPI0029C78C6D|nr:hypothetical protein [Marispirochaeta sp.]
MEKPTVLVPFKPACHGNVCQDVFLYLRPETNGIKVESRIMRVVYENPSFRDAIELTYLANIPGDFLMERRIVERHYHVRIFFARRGYAAFTPGMRASFVSICGAGATEKIIGAYDALQVLGLSSEELFRIWVPQEDFFLLCGQSIKRFKGLYIVNYDIPAILSRNTVSTDIAVMIFRTSLDYTQVHTLVSAIGKELQSAQLLRKDIPLSRVFHYSKSPFEQILDAAGYVYREDGSPEPLANSSFFQYLTRERGFYTREILGALNQPIMRFARGNGEDDILTFTQDDTFPSAADKFSRVEAQSILPLDAPLRF